MSPKPPPHLVRPEFMPVLDLQALAQSTDGDRALQAELVDAFLLQSAGAAVAINQAARRAPLPELIDRLHTLRGAASIVAAWRLVATLAQLEASLRRADIDRLQAARRVQHELGVLRLELEAWRDQADGEVDP